MVRSRNLSCVRCAVFTLMTVASGCSSDAQFGGSERQVEVQQSAIKKGSPNDQSIVPQDTISDAQAANPGGAKSPVDPATLACGQPGAALCPAVNEEKEPKKPAILTRSQTYAVASVQEGRLNFTPETKVLSQGFALRSIFSDNTAYFDQGVRPVMTKQYRQGSPGMTRSQTFSQAGFGVLDLQIVLDNSNSMGEEQNNLSTKLGPLMKAVENSDWRINVVTTDPKDGCSRVLIKRGDVNAASAFKDAVVGVGTGGTPNEQGIRMAVEGLRCTTTSWVRPGSAVAVLIVSDEDNCSDGKGCSAPYNYSETYLLDYLKGTGRTLGMAARVYGLIKIPGATDCTTAAKEGIQYARAANVTGGQLGSICMDDYTAILTRISEDMATLLKKDFVLSEIPARGGLVKILVNGAEYPSSNYVVSGSTVSFTVIPPYGSTIQADYVVGDVTPMYSRFALGEKPFDGSVTVMVDGGVADPKAYSIDPATHEVVFVAMPPASADIRLTFKQNIALKKDYALDARLVKDSVSVKVNGAETRDYDILAGGTLSFRTIPGESAKIEAKYRVKLGPELYYPVSLTGTKVKFLGLYDGTSGSPIKADLVDGTVKVDPVDFMEGRSVQLRYRNEKSGLNQVELPTQPIDGTLVVSPTSGNCASMASGKMVNLDCDVPMGTKLDLKWGYYTPLLTVFKLEGVDRPEAGEWKVLIDGVKTTAYKRVDSTVTLTDAPDPDSKVTLVFTMMD